MSRTITIVELEAAGRSPIRGSEFSGKMLARESMKAAVRRLCKGGDWSVDSVVRAEVGSKIEEFVVAF